MGRPFIIPVFIPHQGCPHDCIFCNQHAISGEQGDLIDEQQVEQTVQRWLSRLSDQQRRERQVEVAFYGGSFTGLPTIRQEQLLGVITPFVQSAQVSRIRVSTRPDYINEQTIALLKKYQVETVELGVQSMDDQVLLRAARGHGKADVVDAVALLKKHQLQVGLQLMNGLPGQSCLSVRQTVRDIIGLQPDFVRIYPVTVVTGSRLEKMYRQGEYRPLSLERAVSQTAFMKKSFERHGIGIIRMGLQAGESLESSIIAGPYHPSFGEMVHARLLLQQTIKLLHQHSGDEDVELAINPRDMSIFKGVGSANMDALSELGLLDTFSLKTDESIPRFQVRITTGAPVPQTS